jgi:hypothetical protein
MPAVVAIVVVGEADRDRVAFSRNIGPFKPFRRTAVAFPG